MAFKTIPRESLRENGLPEKGLNTSKEVLKYLRKNMKEAYALFKEMQRLIGRQHALDKKKQKTRLPRADRRTTKQRIRTVLSRMLDNGLGGLNEVIVHCRAYHVAA
jgi:5-bromo-4-chloroindolyl phosphate hydrolysis protein